MNNPVVDASVSISADSCTAGVDSLSSDSSAINSREEMRGKSPRAAWALDARFCVDKGVFGAENPEAC